ncbi:MAG: GtrA family protein [Candidatus Competibacterales bacterium]
MGNPQTNRILYFAGLRFGQVAVASLVTTMAVTALAHEVFGLSEVIAYPLALAVALVQNFLGLRYYVYPNSRGALLLQFVQYTGSSLVFRGLEYGLFLSLHLLGQLHYLLAVGIVALVSFVTKFFFYRHTIFRPSQLRQTKVSS